MAKREVTSSAISRRSFLGSTACVGAWALLAATLSGCTSGADDVKVDASGDQASSVASGSKTSSQVIVSMTPGSEPPAGFNPFVSWGCGEHVHEPLIQSTLITTNTDLTFKNDLATSYSCSDDGLTWTFTIRDDVVFSDGEPLTAQDVAFTLRSIATNDGAEADLSMVSEVQAPDDTTVVITLNKPFNALLYTLAVVGIVPEHAYGEEYGTHPIGSGRYLLEQWDRGQQVILQANPLYYGDAPTIDRVVVVFMSEDASLAAAQAGQVDVAYTSATLAAALPSGYKLINCNSVDSRGISLPSVASGATLVEEGDMVYSVGNDVTADLAIRQAINYGVDRDLLVEQVLNGYGSPAFSVSDGMPWASEDMCVSTDVARAQRLLDDAGWLMGDDGIREKEGLRASFVLWYMAGDSVRQGLAEAFSAQMHDLGIAVEVKGASFDDIYPHQYSDPVLWGWGSNSPTEIYNLTYSEGWGNFAQYKSDVVDGYLDAALACPNVEDSFELWKDAQWDGTSGIAPEGAATWVWLANIDHLYFVRDGLNLAEQKPHPHGHGWSLVNNVDQWDWLEQ
ncbi:ABC transporter substrate-binding protein [Adlercreutzia agrestimuris]|uniref:ABC transporter substrate-binding protein n=1 Tax=Adlercreutzia agrestimuris TaxID=2941324 RepID=UPI00203F091E|nr:ABC transporter substrate-binding protein [Adlercreutzia agrestimuris]